MNFIFNFILKIPKIPETKSSSAAQAADNTPSGVMLVLDCCLVCRFEGRLEISCRLKDCERPVALTQVHVRLSSYEF